MKVILIIEYLKLLIEVDEDTTTEKGKVLEISPESVIKYNPKNKDNPRRVEKLVTDYKIIIRDKRNDLLQFGNENIPILYCSIEKKEDG